MAQCSAGHTYKFHRLTPCVVAAACLLVLAFSAGVAHAEEPEPEANPVCAEAEEGQAECFALEVELGEESALEEELEEELEGSGERGGFSPTDLVSAYKLNTELGEGQTIAIVDAFDDPNAEKDLAVYRETYGLPACTTENGCFSKLNQEGEEGNYPKASVGWSEEVSLDLDMASAACPLCKVVLVEANSNYYSQLTIAEDLAVSLEPAAISNSWGGSERESESKEGEHFDHPGIPITVSSGDYGYGARWPASSQYVISVGGTALWKDAGTRGWAEEAWNQAGSGCSLYEPKPSWQEDSACANRFTADVSAVADPHTPVSVYDTYEVSGWLLFGGTSASAPIIAAVEALSGEEMRERGAEAFYDGTAAPLFDPTGGFNGNCTPPAERRYYCTALLGFDGPTGNGSPDLTPTETPLVSSAAVEVEAEEAELVGTVDPRGSETHYHFEYGTTNEYGNSAPTEEGSAESGSGNVAVSTTIKGLAPERTYHFRLVATNAEGTTYGEDRHLFTRGTNWAAEPTHVANYGSQGSEAGQFSAPSNVAVSPITGNIFVTDAGETDRIEVFTPEGAVVRQFGSTGSDAGQFQEPSGITIDTQGHVWVSDWSNDRIQEFTESGTFIHTFTLSGVIGHPAGIAVDAHNHIWVDVPAEEAAVEYGEEGNYIRQFSAGNFPLGIAIDEDGNIWTDNNNHYGGRLQEHSEAGDFIKSVAPNGPAQFRWGTAGQLAVDPDGNIWVTSFNTAVYLGNGPREFFSEVDVYSSSGYFEEAFGSLGGEGDQLKDPHGLALDPRGYVWLADTKHARLSKWSIPPLGDLSGVTEPASDVSSFGATLNGGGNPGGFNASYKFEYGKSVSYGSVVPASGAVLDASYRSSDVSEELSGLEPATEYHFRLSMTGLTATGTKTVYGEDRTFTTSYPSVNPDWRIEGASLEELEAWEPYESAGTFTLESTALKAEVEIDCAESGSGTLGYEETIALSECETILNGSKSAACAPADTTIVLGPEFEGAGELLTTFALGEEEECSIGEEFDLTAGTAFDFEAGSTAVELATAMSGGEVLFGGNEAQLSLSSTWALGGKYEGQKFAYAGDYSQLNPDWRIEGASLEELEAWEPYESAGTFTLESTALKAEVEIDCAESGSGTLGYEETIALSECETILNGSKSAACAPADTTIVLGPEFEGAGELLTTFALGEEEECPVGEDFDLTAGTAFDFEAGSTAVELATAMSGGEVLFGGNEAQLSLSSTWALTGKYEGQKFAYAGDYSQLNPDWRIEGASLEELEAWEPYESAGTFTLESTALKAEVEIDCAESGSGTLGYEETIALSECETILNGSKSAACAPADTTIVLGPEFEGAGELLTTFALGEEEECPVGEDFDLTAGTAFDFEAGSTAVELATAMSGGEVLFGGNKAQLSLSSTWALGGKYSGSELGYL